MKSTYSFPPARPNKNECTSAKKRDRRKRLGSKAFKKAIWTDFFCNSLPGICLLIMVMVTGCNNPPATEDRQPDALAVIEVEDHPPVEGWTQREEKVTDGTLTYLEWTGPLNFDHDTGVLRFPLEVGTAGTYAFRMHCRHDDAEFTEANDVFTRINDEGWIKTFSHLNHRAWGWDTRYDTGSHEAFVDPPLVHLKKGRNDFFVGGRSPGFKMDKIIFFDPLNQPDPKERKRIDE